MEQTKLREWIGREVIEQSDGLRRRKGLRNQAYLDRWSNEAEPDAEREGHN